MPDEEVVRHLCSEFADLHRGARDQKQFDRVSLRDEAEEIRQDWKGSHVSLGQQVPLMSRNITFRLSLFYTVKLYFSQTSPDKAAGPIQDPSLMALAGAPGTGLHSSIQTSFSMLCRFVVYL